MAQTNPPILNPRAEAKNRAANAIHVASQFKAGSAPKDPETLQTLSANLGGEQAQAGVVEAARQASEDIAGIETTKQLGDIEAAQQRSQAEDQLSRSIMEQQNKILAMDIGITEDEFADDMMIQQLNETQEFQNATQLLDFARATATNDEEYQDALLAMEQEVASKQREDEWELSVYERLARDETLQKKLALDRKQKYEIKLAQEEAARQAEKSAKKASRVRKAIGVAKVVAGVAIGVATSWTGAGAVAGAGIAAQGASEVAGESN